MKKTLLIIALLSAINAVSAQNPITLSSVCGYPQLEGVYNYNGMVNGKASYIKTLDCSTYISSSQCDAAPYAGSIQWNGSSWVLEETDTGCVWLVQLCVPKSASGTNLNIATNTADTTLPPCSGWDFGNTSCSQPTLSECTSTTLGIIKNTFNNKFKVFPNPSNGNFFIKFQNPLSESLHVSLINSLGQLIWKKEFVSQNLININIKKPSGVYYIKLKGNNNQVANIKLIKN